MTAVRWVAGSLVLLAGCGTPPPPPAEKPAETTPTCEVTMDNLAGHSFIRQTKSADNKSWDDDIMARAHFYTEGEGGALKVKYNTRSLADMYTYTCKKGADEKMLCLEDDPSAADFCRSVISNGAECSAPQIAQLTGLTEAEAQKGIDEVKKELKTLPKDEFEDMKKVFSSPNNQLRGVLYVKPHKSDCMFTFVDNYQTMTFGQLREMQNFVGSAYFEVSDKKLVFEHCKDDEGLIALKAAGGWGKPGETALEWRTGDRVPFRFVGPREQRPQSGCTYSLDAWVQYEPAGLGQSVGTDKSGRLDWSFSHQFPTAGRSIVHMYRYKACGGEPAKLIDVSCQGVRVN